MTKKSSTCYGKSTGKPLTEYGSYFEANQGAIYTNGRYGSNLEPYQCDTCYLWHLSPQERQTATSRSSYCTCVGSDGRSKDAYRTYRDAARRAEILREETRVMLSVYECHDSGLWHLTHLTENLGGFSSRKSTTCQGKRGQMLTEYDTLEDANQGAEFVSDKYGNDVEPWECGTCGKWHLA